MRKDRRTLRFTFAGVTIKGDSTATIKSNPYGPHGCQEFLGRCHSTIIASMTTRWKGKCLYNRYSDPSYPSDEKNIASYGRA